MSGMRPLRTKRGVVGLFFRACGGGSGSCCLTTNGRAPGREGRAWGATVWGRLRATDHHPARVIPACSGRAAVVEDFGVFQHSAEHGVGVRAVPGERFVGTDDEVDGEDEVVGDGAADGVAAAGVVRRRDAERPAGPGRCSRPRSPRAQPPNGIIYSGSKSSMIKRVIAWMEAWFSEVSAMCIRG